MKGTFQLRPYLTFVPLSSLASLGNLASILSIRAEEAGCTASIVTSLRRVIESSEPSCRGSRVSERLEDGRGTQPVTSNPPGRTHCGELGPLEGLTCGHLH